MGVSSLLFILIVSTCALTSSSSQDESFQQCFSSDLQHSNSSLKLIFSRDENTSAYSSILQSSIRNLRFLNSSAPLFIITPLHESHVRAAVICSKKHGVQVRIRSGGHDYEGISYVSHVPFIIIDLANLRSISVDIENENAWVESGATIGELYYYIANKSNVYGFPAGSCPTVGVGGHLSVDLTETPWEKISFGPSEEGEGQASASFLPGKLGVADAPTNGGKTVQVSFDGLFLGPVEKLLPLMRGSFPEFGLESNNCTEMSWIESVLYFAGFSTNGPLEVLLDRPPLTDIFFKAKSDYVKEPISKTGLEGLWKRLMEDESSYLILTPYGGKMSDISDSETPFPHRSVNLYKIQYSVSWSVDKETEEHMRWMRSLYAYMKPYVSKSPREAYMNYNDLDLGVNNNGNTSYAQASIWGLKYFKNNFKRLVHVKTVVDPANFFKNEQSIPVFPSQGKR
ncbi:hypothetical protein FH972_000716 [Carpinus fangiana]|uniref:FAD-binding PCMH-type domain-containing protein n=1 Tax=Carpinus fangiana TaxID=176857 RepID=A0A5N6QC73_9ROSI|nr:hypothetical protein FH972_000716 [Carpinus fangiana]